MLTKEQRSLSLSKRPPVADSGAFDRLRHRSHASAYFVDHFLKANIKTTQVGALLAAVGILFLAGCSSGLLNSAPQEAARSNQLRIVIAGADSSARTANPTAVTLAYTYQVGAGEETELISGTTVITLSVGDDQTIVDGTVTTGDIDGSVEITDGTVETGTISGTLEITAGTVTTDVVTGDITTVTGGTINTITGDDKAANALVVLAGEIDGGEIDGDDIAIENATTSIDATAIGKLFDTGATAVTLNGSDLVLDEVTVVTGKALTLGTASTLTNETITVNGATFTEGNDVAITLPAGTVIDGTTKTITLGDDTDIGEAKLTIAEGGVLKVASNTNTLALGATYPITFTNPVITAPGSDGAVLDGTDENEVVTLTYQADAQVSITASAISIIETDDTNYVKLTKAGLFTGTDAGATVTITGDTGIALGISTSGASIVFANGGTLETRGTSTVVTGTDGITFSGDNTWTAAAHVADGEGDTDGVLVITAVDSDDALIAGFTQDQDGIYNVYAEGSLTAGAGAGVITLGDNDTLFIGHYTTLDISAGGGVSLGNTSVISLDASESATDGGGAEATDVGGFKISDTQTIYGTASDSTTVRVAGTSPTGTSTDAKHISTSSEATTAAKLAVSDGEATITAQSGGHDFTNASEVITAGS